MCLSDTEGSLLSAESENMHCFVACTNWLPSQYKCLALCRMIYSLTEVICYVTEIFLSMFREVSVEPGKGAAEMLAEFINIAVVPAIVLCKLRLW